MDHLFDLFSSLATRSGLDELLSPAGGQVLVDQDMRAGRRVD